jgi:hypothetical protein
MYMVGIGIVLLAGIEPAMRDRTKTARVVTRHDCRGLSLSLLANAVWASAFGTYATVGTSDIACFFAGW